MSDHDIQFKLTGESSKLSSTLKETSKNLTSVGRASKSATSGFAGLFSAIRKNNTAFSNITKDANRMSSSMIGLGKAGAILKMGLGAGAVLGLGAGLQKAVQGATDMIEVANLFTVAMGDATDETEKFVNEFTKITNFDDTNIKSAIGTFGLLARTMGINEENSRVLSENMYKLGADLSSLTNIPINQAMADLRSGLIGQSETVYKYGIDVTEASLKTEALAQGITKSVRNMSQGEKMALRYGIMIRQTTLAQGDLARTIDTVANQLRIMGERVTTLARSVGTIFIPALSVMLPYLNAVLTVMINIANAIAKVFGYEAPKSQGNPLGTIKEDAEGASDAIEDTKKSLKAMLGMDELNLIDKSKSKDEGSGVSAGDPNLFDFTGYDNMLSGVKTKTDLYVAQIQATLSKLVEYFQKLTSPLVVPLTEIGKNVLASYVFLYEKVLVPISKVASEGLVPNLFKFLGELLETVAIAMNRVSNNSTVFTEKLFTPYMIGVVQLLSDALEVMTSGLSVFNDKLAVTKFENSEVGRIFSEVWTVILNTATSVWNSLKPLLDSFITLLKAIGDTMLIVWEEFLSPVLYSLWDALSWVVTDGVVPLMTAFVDLATSVADFTAKVIMPIVNGILKVLLPVLKTFATYIIDVFATALKGITNLSSHMMNILSGILKFLTGVFTLDWRKAWEGIVQIMGGIFGGVGSIVTSVMNSVIDVVNTMISAVTNGLNSVITQMNGFDIKVPDWVPVVGGKGFDVNIPTLKTPRLPKLARGGMLGYGDVFSAGEGGKAELLGSFNNKTTVMPLENSGFVEAMYNAVYSAVTESMSNGGQVIENVVKLDGDVIYKNQERVKQNRGVEFNMGVFARG